MAVVLKEIEKVQSDEDLARVAKGLTEILIERIPALSNGWGLGLVCSSFLMLQCAVFTALMVVLNAYSTYATGAGELATLAIVFALCFLVLLLLYIPARVTGICNACLKELNHLALNQPHLHAKVEILERRLTGGSSWDHDLINFYGFTIFGTRVTVTLLKQMLVSLVSVGSVAIPIILSNAE